MRATIAFVKEGPDACRDRDIGPDARGRIEADTPPRAEPGGARQGPITGAAGTAHQTVDDVGIDVLVVEDNPLIGALYAKVLRRESDVRITDFATSVTDAHAKLAEVHVDVVLMDYKLADGDGITAAARIRGEHPRTRVLIVTGVKDDQLVADALAAGCAGCIQKTDAIEHLPAAIRAAHAGSTALLG